MPEESSTGSSITWTGASFGRTSMPLGRKKGKLRRGGNDGARVGRRFGGPREKPGWLLHQDTHLRAEGGGKPVAILITAGERHEQSVFEALMETGAVKREGRGRPRIRPGRVVGDKDYSSGKSRAYLRRLGIGAVIARQNNEKRRGHFDKRSEERRVGKECR